MNGPVSQSQNKKPPYYVPLVQDIKKIPWNRKTILSTFSGCGGSCLGLRMCGFKVLWANEFIKSAREAYHINFPTTIIDSRDIRAIKPKEILKTLSLSPLDIDILEGSPPCASFSTAGSRQGGWNQIRDYSETRQRVDDLFFEFIRIVKGIQPKVFIAENVLGLVTGISKGYFKLILEEMKALPYLIKVQRLEAQWLGVPQLRQRLFFIGVHKNLKRLPVFPKPLPYRYSIEDAIPWLQFKTNIPKNKELLYIEPESNIERFKIGKEWKKLHIGQHHKKFFQLYRSNPRRPSGTITTLNGAPGLATITGRATITHPYECRYFSIAELKRLASFPDDFILTGTYIQQYERIARSVPPLMMKAIGEIILQEVLS